MKRVIPLLLALALLTGCGGNPTPVEPDPLPEDSTPAATETITLPETGPAGTLSASAVVMEGREPVENYELPKTVPSNPLAEASFPMLLAELPEANAAFYVLQEETVLIRWGDSMAEFDWLYFTPRQILPRLFCFDADGDWEDELIVICYIGSGTGVSIEELHILEKNSDGTLTAYTLPENLWQKEVPKLFDTAELGGRTFAILGHELVEFNHEHGGPDLDLDSASSGLIAEFSTEEWGGLRFRGAFCLSPPDSAAPCYVVETSADILYQDGIFTLQDFHLYSYDQ